eukprot:COSAG05_NODE_43_length_25931_cov_49.314636_29_plen_160_part_00
MANQSKKECQQCTAQTNSGRRCKNRTCKSGKCWQHLKRDDGLRVKPSQISSGGTGLWTTKRIKPNQRIGRYTGESMTRSQLQQRYGNQTAQYALCSSKNKCVDARKTNSSAVRFANDARRTQFKNNARLRGLNLVAGSRGIPANREIFAAYGPDYWRNM